MTVGLFIDSISICQDNHSICLYRVGRWFDGASLPSSIAPIAPVKQCYCGNYQLALRKLKHLLNRPHNAGVCRDAAGKNYRLYKFPPAAEIALQISRKPQTQAPQEYRSSASPAAGDVSYRFWQIRCICPRSAADFALCNASSANSSSIFMPKPLRLLVEK